MQSESEPDVKRFITEGINRLKQNLVNVSIIFHFVDSIIDKIEEFESMDLDTDQKRIIKVAKAECKKQIRGLDFRRQS